MLPARIRTVAPVERFFQFSLLGLVASGFFALAGSNYLDRPTLILTSLALLVRALMVAGWLRLEIPARLISIAAVGYLIFYPIDFYLISHNFLTATVHGVCFLAAIKILTAQTNRDYLYTGAVAFIELIGAALLSFRAGFFSWLALYILFTIAAFTSAEIRRAFQRSEQVVSPPAVRIGWRLSAIALIATAGILAITGGLFLIVPRTARAAAMLFPNAPRLTGFSNVVDLGGFGEISKDTRPVMHVLSYTRPFPQNLKWRGTALSRFDGRRWSEPPSAGFEVVPVRGQAEVAGELQRSRRGARMLYRVDVNSSDTGTLFVAGVPEFINLNAPRLLRSSEDSFRALAVPGEQLSYEVSAHPGPPLPSPLSTAERRRYLDLPPIDTRIWSLARAWAGDGSALQRAARIQLHLRRDFRYSLETANGPVRDPLSNFLFVTKRGYCEYFASAMAVMLRTIGIPSRVATGFQNGYFNNVSGMYVVRASDAHAWVEGWIENAGWVTFDPTPSVPPPSAGILARMDMYLDAVDSMWQQWVMAYDLGHQAALAAKFESALRSWNQARTHSHGHWTKVWLSRAGTAGMWILPLLAAAAFVILAAPRLLRKIRKNSDLRRIARSGASPADASRLYSHMLDIMSRRGFQKPAWFTPLEFAGHLPPSEAAHMVRFTLLYNAVRFGGDAAAAGELARMLSESNP